MLVLVLLTLLCMRITIATTVSDGDWSYIGTEFYFTTLAPDTYELNNNRVGAGKIYDNSTIGEFCPGCSDLTIWLGDASYVLITQIFGDTNNLQMYTNLDLPQANSYRPTRIVEVIGSIFIPYSVSFRMIGINFTVSCGGSDYTSTIFATQFNMYQNYSVQFTSDNCYDQLTTQIIVDEDTKDDTCKPYCFGAINGMIIRYYDPYNYGKIGGLIALLILICGGFVGLYIMIHRHYRHSENYIFVERASTEP